VICAHVYISPTESLLAGIEAQSVALARIAKRPSAHAGRAKGMEIRKENARQPPKPHN